MIRPSERRKTVSTSNKPKEPQILTLLHALRDYGVAPLHTPCDKHLRLRSTQLLRNHLHLGRINNLGSPNVIVSQRRVSCDVDVLLFAVGNEIILREERMGFDLVYSRDNAGVGDDVLESFNTEV